MTAEHFCSPPEILEKKSAEGSTAPLLHCTPGFSTVSAQHTYRVGHTTATTPHCVGLVRCWHCSCLQNSCSRWWIG